MVMAEVVVAEVEAVMMVVVVEQSKQVKVTGRIGGRGLSPSWMLFGRCTKRQRIFSSR